MSEICTTIPIGMIDEPRFILRPVLRQSKEYLELRSSIEQYGLLTSVLVRPKGDRYELVGGRWRWTACMELRRESMPCIVRGMNDDEAIALQLQENAVRFETKPVEYANQLKRLLDRSPGMTEARLAKLVSKHPNWIKDRLGLMKLDKPIQLLIDRGEMPVGNAVMLAKIPQQWRLEQVDNACHMATAEFKSLAGAIVKQYMECVRQGKLDARFKTAFKPVAYARKPKEVQAELDDPQIGATLIVSENCKSFLDAYQLGLRWGYHLDRESIESLRRQAEREGRLESEGDDVDD